jgi:hypothetical protein
LKKKKKLKHPPPWTPIHHQSFKLFATSRTMLTLTLLIQTMCLSNNGSNNASTQINPINTGSRQADWWH